jgi:phosphohistidine phosphatase
VRRLVLFRHAKADRPRGVNDLERPLTERGRRDAAAAGRWIADSGLVLDLVLCSPSQRTRETWAWAADALTALPTVHFDERVYDASAPDLLEVVTGVPDPVGTLLLVGHNPGMEEFAAAIADKGGGDERARARMAKKFPTSAVAVFAVEGGWAEVASGAASLAAFVVPRG